MHSRRCLRLRRVFPSYGVSGRNDNPGLNQPLVPLHSCRLGTSRHDYARYPPRLLHNLLGPEIPCRLKLAKLALDPNQRSSVSLPRSSSPCHGNPRSLHSFPGHLGTSRRGVFFRHLPTSPGGSHSFLCRLLRTISLRAGLFSPSDRSPEQLPY